MIAERQNGRQDGRDTQDGGTDEKRRAAAAIGKSAERKLKARRTQRRGIWFGLGMFGLVGWAVAIPTLMGVALGVWLDAHFESGRSWTLALLLAGIVLGCLNAWYWVSRESRHD